jgi:hypothetical protein
MLFLIILFEVQGFVNLSFLFMDRSLRGKVKLLLIDDTRIEVGDRDLVLFVAFEPRLRRAVYMRLFEVANIFTALFSWG